VIWTLLDITERAAPKTTSAQRLNARRKLNDLRSRFVVMTSHEFRTPLAAILSAPSWSGTTATACRLTNGWKSSAASAPAYSAWPACWTAYC
jgi:signal transduction histidine kinase